MEHRLTVEGGYPLSGRVVVQGSKNAALPILIASILSGAPLKISNVPLKLLDIQNLLSVLKILNVDVNFQDDPNSVILNGKMARKVDCLPVIATKLRASILLLGPLLTRFGYVKIPFPGGCSIGERPMNIHAEVFEKMGAHVKFDNNFFCAHAPKGLQGSIIKFENVSVGATENALFAATLAQGKTLLVNAAKEPEIVDLVRCLRKMGASIKGEGTSVIEIEGVVGSDTGTVWGLLGGARYHVMPDRIEAGSYAIAALATRGDIFLDLNYPPNVLSDEEYPIFGNIWNLLGAAGGSIELLKEGLIRVFYKEPLKSTPMTTDPFPGFPTDLQPMWVVLMCLAQDGVGGECLVEDKIFEKRFQYVEHLNRIGGEIKFINEFAVNIKGMGRFQVENNGQVLMGTDLRATFALVVAALCCLKGKQVLIEEVQHLDRGYVDWVQKLVNLGAQIKRH